MVVQGQTTKKKKIAQILKRIVYRLFSGVINVFMQGITTKSFFFSIKVKKHPLKINSRWQGRPIDIYIKKDSFLLGGRYEGLRAKIVLGIRSLWRTAGRSYRN